MKMFKCGMTLFYGAVVFLLASVAAGQDSLVSIWNDQKLTTFSVFPSDGSKFTYPSHWAVKQGGWSDTTKWVAADFNGDNRTDIGAAWNNGGKSTLTVRLSDGKTFTPAHWMVNGGGWSDKSVWLGGDFNGDGKGDMAGVWHDGDNTSIAVYLSDGTKFLAPTQWSLRDGGWADSTKWVAGDFNGDGRTDLCAIWNHIIDGKGNTFRALRISDGKKFAPGVQWDRGDAGWNDSHQWIAGDFNKDGMDDLAKSRGFLGQHYVSLYPSERTKFGSSESWAHQDGGAPEGYKTIAGDFNGDGKTDLMAAWNDKGKNVLTMRASNGKKFEAPVHWSQEGGWNATTAWLPGNFGGGTGPQQTGKPVKVVADVDYYDRAPDQNGEQNGVIKGVLKAETPGVTRLESRGNWHHVKWPAGSGWVYSSNAQGEFKSIEDL